MDSEEAARASAQLKHNKYMVFGKKYRYIEVFQCSGDDMNLVLNGGLHSPANATKPALLSPGMLSQPQTHQTTSPQNQQQQQHNHHQPQPHHHHHQSLSANTNHSQHPHHHHPLQQHHHHHSIPLNIPPPLTLSIPPPSPALIAQQQAQFIAQQNLLVRQQAAAAAAAQAAALAQAQSVSQSEPHQYYLPSHLALLQHPSHQSLTSSHHAAAAAAAGLAFPPGYASAAASQQFPYYFMHNRPPQMSAAAQSSAASQYASLGLMASPYATHGLSTGSSAATAAQHLTQLPPYAVHAQYQQQQAAAAAAVAAQHQQMSASIKRTYENAFQAADPGTGQKRHFVRAGSATSGTGGQQATTAPAAGSGAGLYATPYYPPSL